MTSSRVVKNCFNRDASKCVKVKTNEQLNLMTGCGPMGVAKVIKNPPMTLTPTNSKELPTKVVLFLDIITKVFSVKYF